MKATKLIATILLACGTIFISCKKEQGPKGDTGAAGTANIENKTVTVHPSDWAMDSLHGQMYFNYACSSNSQSAVLCYVDMSAGRENLPYHDNATNMRYEFATDLTASSPYIQLQVTNLGTPTAVPTSDKVFYFVIIPPAMKKPGVNYSNYSEVKAAHNL